MTGRPSPHMSPPWQRPGARRSLIIGFAAFLGLLAACSDDGGSEGAADPATSESPETSSAVETVEVRAVDFEFDDLPEQLAAGSTLRLVNDSSVEVHELVAFLVPDDEERPVEELLALPEDEVDALLAGPPALVLVAAPGEESFTAVGDGTLDEPGRYVLLCAIPTGADPQAYFAAVEESDGPPDVEGGPPHFVHGMVGEIAVER